MKIEIFQIHISIFKKQKMKIEILRIQKMKLREIIELL